MDRRKFMTLSTAAGLSGLTAAHTAASSPVVISTWRHGLPANDAAWQVMKDGGSALDAAEAGVRITEADPEVRTVGLGGRPDRDGVVSLDAAIMRGDGGCGSVAALRDIVHPISVARRVMERTPHVMLVGAGARRFAISEGFTPTELLTAKSRQEYQAWLASHPEGYRPPINVENHDTIGLLTLDPAGKLAAACTTSGASYKYHGRVGDSPIVGAGLYCDGAVGAATATGWGEAVIRACGSFLVVELMRQGHHPQQACRLAVERVVEKNPDWRDIQVGFIALDIHGRTGAYCLQPGFDYARYTVDRGNELLVPPNKSDDE